MIHIGTSGWSYDHWIGRFYPPGMNKAKWLGFYTNYFSTVELNMSFYRTPALSTVQKWVDKTPENFRFAIKASREITHENKLQDAGPLLSRQNELIDAFLGKAGSVLYQLPPSFRYNETNRDILRRFLDRQPDNCPAVFEFRDPSWWCDSASNLLRGRASFCSVDGLAMPDDLILDQSLVYIRLHGERYHGFYSDEWLRKLSSKLIPYGASREIFVYFNNDVDGGAITNARSLRSFIDG